MRDFLRFWSTSQIFLNFYSENPPRYNIECENQVKSSIQAFHNHVLLQSRKNFGLRRLRIVVNANLHVALKYVAIPCEYMQTDPHPQSCSYTE